MNGTDPRRDTRYGDEAFMVVAQSCFLQLLYENHSNRLLIRKSRPGVYVEVYSSGLRNRIGLQRNARQSAIDRCNAAHYTA